MDAYLQIAQQVLRFNRRPLSPRAMLAMAYREGIVPDHLHGKTQHKTLQARLAEDILSRREGSVFFRTGPGRFFLREFLNDPSIPDEYRQVFPARRRARELRRDPALYVSRDRLKAVAREGCPINPKRVFGVLDEGASYEDPKNNSPDHALLWSFVAVTRGSEVLSYRMGRYRSERDGFMSRRCIGFSTLVSRNDVNLFNISDFGIIDAGVKAASIDLDLPEMDRVGAADSLKTSLLYFIWVPEEERAGDLLAIVDLKCPEWFEPVKRRLALNDLCWLDLDSSINNIDDFDPWSRQVLEARSLLKWGRYSKGEALPRLPGEAEAWLP
ncbi:MAG: winged helix-turn-helix domain-containing protein [Caenispirillum bisanense]|nr:winged helix-turn-helix domain-containing protein [Caenispirillum bisanense]